MEGRAQELETAVMPPAMSTCVPTGTDYYGLSDLQGVPRTDFRSIPVRATASVMKQPTPVSPQVSELHIEITSPFSSFCSCDQGTRSQDLVSLRKTIYEEARVA